MGHEKVHACLNMTKIQKVNKQAHSQQYLLLKVNNKCHLRMHLYNKITFAVQLTVFVFFARHTKNIHIPKMAFIDKERSRNNYERKSRIRKL